MPITKVLQIKKTENLKRSINYITQDAKTLKAETNTLEQDSFPIPLGTPKLVSLGVMLSVSRYFHVLTNT